MAVIAGWPLQRGAVVEGDHCNSCDVVITIILFVFPVAFMKDVMVCHAVHNILASASHIISRVLVLIPFAITSFSIS